MKKIFTQTFFIIISLLLAQNSVSASSGVSEIQQKATIAEGENDDWKEIATTTQPEPRAYADMASLGNGMALLFSGSNNAHTGNTDSLTWVYDTETHQWADMNPAGPVPAVRYKHGMAYAGGDKAIVFGGQNDNGGPFNDTWLYDYSENSWVQSASVPSDLWPRLYPCLSYIGDNKVLLFGGWDESGVMGDTWVYDVEVDTWTKLDPTASPSPRHTEMAYIGGDKALLYGEGIDKSTDTWIFDLSENTWVDMSPATNPGSRTGHGMAYLGDGNLLLYAGFTDGYAKLADSWVYNVENNTWTEETPETTPPPGYAITTMCETSVNGSSYIVCFGGRGDAGGAGDASNLTFEFGGADWALDNEPVSAHTFILPEINIYPNPVKEKLKVSFNERIEMIEVFNLSGIKLISKQINKEKNTLFDVSTLTNGAYILKIASEKGHYSKMFIKE